MAPDEQASDGEAEAHRRLRQRAVERMRRARGDLVGMRRSITAYLREGYSSVDAYFSPGALVDYFCVDCPSILDDAGYDESEADEAVALFDEIHAVVAKEFFRPGKSP
jgi:hypothetical protein